MALLSLKATNFRCLESFQASFDPVANLIIGPNAAGKTSVLESIAYLGRGRSFRGATVDGVIRHGQKELVLFGLVDSGGKERRIGLRNSSAGLELSIDGDGSGGVAALAACLPLQVIDPDVHNLVGGGPEERRRYLDWLGFHVEHRYLDGWRKYRRALRQRNAVLKTAPRPSELDVWDRELAMAGEALDLYRVEVFEILSPILKATASRLVQADIDFSYRRGWKGEQPLLQCLKANRESDVARGNTSAGPHRSDVGLRFDERQARKLVSRGQQKLLACGMILAGVEVVQEVIARPLTLLLDDPAAELDPQSLSRLMAAVNGLCCQVVATSLNPDASIFDTKPRMFHVEQGALKSDD